MNTMFLMLCVTACYTLTSLSDKYAVSDAKFTRNEFTFLMCASMSFFLLFTLPFQELYFTLSWHAVVAVGLITLCKFLEFQMSALVLKQLTAFELKAWLGITLFASYITDVLYGMTLKILPIICIVTTVIGLIFIAKSGKNNNVEYRKIIIPLFFYLVAKYGYGLVLKAFGVHIAPNLQLFLALVIIAGIMLVKIKPPDIVLHNKKSTILVIVARIPNTLGMLLENILISISLSNYSFVQPMILVTLFVIGLVRKEQCTKLSIIGSILCVTGVILFQIL